MLQGAKKWRTGYFPWGHNERKFKSLYCHYRCAIFQAERGKEDHGQAYAPQGAMGLKLWGSLASKLAAYLIALGPHLWCQACL